MEISCFLMAFSLFIVNLGEDTRCSIAFTRLVLDESYQNLLETYKLNVFMSCSVCYDPFHPKCAFLTEESFACFSKIKDHVTWMCDNCKDNYNKLQIDKSNLLEEVDKLNN